MRCGYVQNGPTICGEGVGDEASVAAFPARFGAEEAGGSTVGEEHKRL